MVREGLPEEELFQLSPEGQGVRVLIQRNENMYQLHSTSEELKEGQCPPKHGEYEEWL